MNKNSCIFFLTVFLAACAFDPTNVVSNKDLQQAINENDFSPEQDLIEDTGKQIIGSPDALVSESPVLAEDPAYAPAPRFSGWGRIDFNTADLNRDLVESDALAGKVVVRTTRKLTGNLVIYSNVAQLRSRGTNFVAFKPFSLARNFRTSLQKQSGKWVIQEWTWAVSSSPSPRVEIVSCKILPNASGDFESVTVLSDDLDRMRNAANLPSLPANRTVRLEVVAKGTGTTPLVYVHHEGTRIGLYERGTSGVFTNQLRIGSSKAKKIHVDVLDAATINQPAQRGNYGGVIWSLVFR